MIWFHSRSPGLYIFRTDTSWTVVGKNGGNSPTNSDMSQHALVSNSHWEGTSIGVVWLVRTSDSPFTPFVCHSVIGLFSSPYLLTIEQKVWRHPGSRGGDVTVISFSVTRCFDSHQWNVWTQRVDSTFQTCHNTHRPPSQRHTLCFPCDSPGL